MGLIPRGITSHYGRLQKIKGSSCIRRSGNICTDAMVEKDKSKSMTQASCK